MYLSTAFKNLLISIDRDPRYRTVVVVGHSYISKYLLAGPVSSIKQPAAVSLLRVWNVDLRLAR